MSKKSKATSTLFLYRRLPYEHLPDHHGDDLSSYSDCPYHSKHHGDNDDEPIGRCKSCPLCQSDKIRHKQESVHNDPLVLDELRQMRGEPVWCKELECYGIVKMEKVGSWANELFLVGTWHNGDAAVNFEYDIKSRGLTLYRHKPEEGAV